MPKIAQSLSKFTKKELDNIFSVPRKRIKISGLDFILAPRSLDFARVLVVTPKKLGAAPKRNKIRRQIKSIFYQEKLFEISYDCIIVVKKEAMQLKFQELKDIMFRVLKNETL